MCCKKSRIQRIIEGWGNYVFRTPESELIAYERAKYCAVCPDNKFEWCNVCKCYIPAKVRSMAEQCPKKLW